MSLITRTDYTIIKHENEYSFYAPVKYVITDKHEKVLAKLKFQEGSLKKFGKNGIFNDDLLQILIDRYTHFQNNDMDCEENYQILRCLIEAYEWSRKRIIDRTKRCVINTNAK